MAEITIQETVWQEIVRAARRSRKKPEKLADDILRDFFQRQADEELLEKSSRQAQKTTFHIRDTEQIIREHRTRKNKT